MKVYIIGAGPGAKDLITLRGHQLISKAKICLYTGSLISNEMRSEINPSAELYDTSTMVLDEIIEIIKKAHHEDIDVMRLHSGDPSIYGAIAEQIRYFKKLKIDYEIIPGVPAFASASAEMGIELTLPTISQSIILTRVEGQASPMPKKETLEILGKSGSASIVIHLSIKHLSKIVDKLKPYYGSHCPIAIVYRSSWNDQKIIRGKFSDISQKVQKAKITKTALIFIGPVIDNDNFSNSKLYDPIHKHIFRAS